MKRSKKESVFDINDAVVEYLKDRIDPNFMNQH